MVHKTHCAQRYLLYSTNSFFFSILFHAHLEHRLLVVSSMGKLSPIFCMSSALQPVEGLGLQPNAGLTSTCSQRWRVIWPVVCFLDEDYHYRSVATQIPHDAELAQIRAAEDRTQDCVRGSLMFCLKPTQNKRRSGSLHDYWKGTAGNQFHSFPSQFIIWQVIDKLITRKKIRKCKQILWTRYSGY